MVIVFRALILLLVATALAAQERRGFFFQPGLAVASPIGGEYRLSVGPALEVVAGVDKPGRWIIAGGASMQVGLPHGDSCTFDKSGTRCLEDLPFVRALTALAGYTIIQESSWSLHLLGGPGLYLVDGDDFGEHTKAGGLDARIELAGVMSRRVSVVAILRGAFIPAFPDDARGLRWFGVGLRIH
jgi:hypothetical protein